MYNTFFAMFCNVEFKSEFVPLLLNSLKKNPFVGRDAHRHPHTDAGLLYFILVFFSPLVWLLSRIKRELIGGERFVSGRGECVRVKL